MYLQIGFSLAAGTLASVLLAAFAMLG